MTTYIRNTLRTKRLDSTWNNYFKKTINITDLDNNIISIKPNDPLLDKYLDAQINYLWLNENGLNIKIQKSCKKHVFEINEIYHDYSSDEENIAEYQSYINKKYLFNKHIFL